mgnify:CR=1 FL=1
MAYDTILAQRIRERFALLDHVEEKEMMGGLTFMYNNKMCVGIIKDEMMCRIDPDIHEDCLLKQGCRTMDFTNRPMKGYVMISHEGMETQKDFDFWINLALAFNAKARSSKKKK